jgi:16S rRNA (cytosine1402-N4)-methyltransferase
MHEPVLLSEAIQALALRADGLYLDGTFGRGGHSRAILERLGPAGQLLALDRDPAAQSAAKEIQDARFTFVRAPFSALTEVLAARRMEAEARMQGVETEREVARMWARLNFTLPEALPPTQRGSSREVSAR